MNWLVKINLNVYANWRGNIILLLLLFFNLSIGYSQYLEIETERLHARYTTNETINFVVTGSAHGQAKFEIYGDSRTGTYFTGQISLNGSRTTFSYSVNKPGVYLCKVIFNGVQRVTTVLVDHHKIAVLGERPSGFDYFWDSLKNELNSIPINPNVDLYLEDKFTKTYQFSFDILNQRKVYGYISVPKNEGSFASIITLPPFGKGPNVSIPEQLIANELNVLSVSVNIHNYPSYVEATSAYIDDPTHKDKFYYKWAILGVIRVIDYLETRTDFNKEIALVGVSQGGGLAAIVAGLDKRVNFLAISNPALTQHLGLKYKRATGFPQYLESYYRNNQTDEIPKVEQSVLYYEAVHFAKKFTGTSYVVATLQDDVCPSEGSFALFNALQNEKTMTYVKKLGHSHPEGYWLGRLSFFKTYLSNTELALNPTHRQKGWNLLITGLDSVLVNKPLSLASTVTFNDRPSSSLPHEWRLKEGPYLVTFSSKYDTSTDVYFTKEGNYEIELIVRDDESQLNRNVFIEVIKTLKIEVLPTSSTATDELAEIEKSIIFPNPFTSQLNIKLSGYEEANKILIMDIKGTLIKTFELRNKRELITLNLEKILSGLYLVVVKRNNKTLDTHKIIKL